jgi:hypothetical protein
MSTVSSPLLCSSDKSFWHGYIDFYEPYLPQNILGNIVEFGVFNGHSIQWLMERYPHANIVGVDILPTQAEWPQAPQVRYVQLDQGSEKQIASFFAGIPAPALIIEDGSHIPEHQSRCLKHGLKKLTPGGTYILEDIHTSHPEHILFKREFGSRSIMERIGLKPIKPAQTSLSILLAVEHILRSGRQTPTQAELEKMGAGPHFSTADILQLFEEIQSVHVYKRTTLPTSCFNCGSSLFEFNSLKCICGVDLLSAADSMSIVIRKRL